MRPPRRPGVQRDRVPRASRESLLHALDVGVGSARERSWPDGACWRVVASSRTRRSVCADRKCAASMTAEQARPGRRGHRGPARARAWPSLTRPSSTATGRGARPSADGACWRSPAANGPTRRATCLLCQPELIDEPAEGARLVHGVEVGTLEVLHEGQCELLLVVGASRTTAGMRLEAGQSRRPARGARRRSAGSRRRPRSPGRAAGRRAPRRSRPAPASCARSNVPRGWYGLRRMRSSGDLAEVRSSSAVGGIERSEAAAEATDRAPRLDGHGGSPMPAVRRVQRRASAAVRARKKLGREVAGTPARPARSGCRAGSAGRSSAPRPAGRCGARSTSKTWSPRCRRTSALTSAERVVRASIHRQHDALELQRGIEVVADEVDGGHQLPEALEGVVLALDRDEHAVGGGEGVDGEQAQGRWAVEEDVVVAARPIGPALGQAPLASLDRNQLDLCAGQVARRRDDGEPLDARRAG